MPAFAGIHYYRWQLMDSRLRGNDNQPETVIPAKAGIHLCGVVHRSEKCGSTGNGFPPARE